MLNQKKYLMQLSEQERLYYSRQMRLAEIGEQGQLRLKNSSVLVIGLGGLGSPAALYLTAAGIGTLGIVEFDQIDASNLHRQILYEAKQVGQSKLQSGAERLRSLNPHIKIIEHKTRFSAENALELVNQYDVVVDGADNFTTRYLVNDACVLKNKPLVSASILGFEGQLSVFHYQGGPCYRCLYPEPPEMGAVPSCAEAGVLGALPGIMGSLQASETLKIILGKGHVNSGRLLYFDALTTTFSDLKIHRQKDCAVCGERPTITKIMEVEQSCAVAQEISVTEVKKAMANYVLLDVREDDERAICKIEPSIHIPLAELPQRKNSLPKDKPIVCYCRSGNRSARAAQFLVEHGFTKVFNMTGGILNWADEIDPQMKKY
jgi:sulfur-carrier protein adenylyltransferase/sulfurtransferase